MEKYVKTASVVGVKTGAEPLRDATIANDVCIEKMAETNVAKKITFVIIHGAKLRTAAKVQSRIMA